MQTSSNTRDDRRPGFCQMLGFGKQSSSPARAVEIGLDPRMVVLQHLFQRADADLLIDQNRNAIADRKQRVEVMGYHEYREAQTAPQVANQGIEIAGCDGIEPGRGLVEKDDFRVEREGSRKAGALAHPTGQLGRIFFSCPLGEPDDADLESRDLVHQTQRHGVVFLQRHFDVLRHRQGTEERAILKQHSPPLLDLPSIDITVRRYLVPENFDAARDRPVEPDDGAQQNRFSRSGRSDDTENLATEDVEIETVVDCFGAEPGDKAAHADDRLARIIRHAQICKAEKKIENPASVTITRKIASTTDNVVRRPTLSALPVT